MVKKVRVGSGDALHSMKMLPFRKDALGNFESDLYIMLQALKNTISPSTQARGDAKRHQLYMSFLKTSVYGG